MHRRLLVAAATAGLAATLALPALPAGAQTAAGGRAITIIVPYAPGATDREVRALAAVAEKTLGQPVVVENRPGGGGAIGAQAVARAAPDGQTLLYAAAAVATALPLLRQLPYGFDDLVPVARMTANPHVLAARADAPFRTLAEMIAYARANPEKVVFGSSGAGTAVHLAGAAFARRAGIRINHVPFQGLAPAIAAALGGTVDFVIGLPVAIVPQAEAGKLRPLAQFGATRAPTLPNVPTLREQGVDLTLTVDIGLMAPKATPPATIARIAEAFRGALASPEFTTFARTGRITPGYLGPAEFGAALRADREVQREIISALGLGRR